MNKASKPYKKFWRSRQDSRIAGVCGGLGEYFHIDPIWIRILFVLFFLAGGAALVIYVVIWLLVPLEPLDGTKSPIPHENN
ncbi:PspC domain-containing protein [Legionella maioricensis]|uniref:PspC domain-containing protein n=1 Tax=Legionella maioricensis TaxID=2896528 RepID=A0A9X2IB76_9GAMM|nr:PspC domain-containing protein [Legionella maioricensis]MCL9683137.1 PspC domain-containing protein [Legionella maioricensis]MCL9688036.1 PspC domain-containing protein [Legionella maioricensis]